MFAIILPTGGQEAGPWRRGASGVPIPLHQLARPRHPAQPAAHPELHQEVSGGQSRGSRPHRRPLQVSGAAT